MRGELGSEGLGVRSLQEGFEFFDVMVGGSHVFDNSGVPTKSLFNFCELYGYFVTEFGDIAGKTFR